MGGRTRWEWQFSLYFVACLRWLCSCCSLLFHVKGTYFQNVILQALNTQEESHRMTAVRKVYQKAIVTPTHHIEQIWKEYENFENSVSRQLVILWFWNVNVKWICVKHVCIDFFLWAWVWYLISERYWKDRQSDDIALSRQKDWYLNINPNLTVPGLFIGSGRSTLMESTGICLLYHQLALTRQFCFLICCKLWFVGSQILMFYI